MEMSGVRESHAPASGWEQERRRVASRCGMVARCEFAVSKARVAAMQACQDAQEATVVNVRGETRGVVVFTGVANLRSWSASDGRRAAAAGSGGWNPEWTVPSTHVCE